MTRNRSTITIVAAMALLAMVAGGAGAFSFSDIDYWVGSGSNQAAIVIDWNDGINPASLAWGYRWTGAATGYDMFNAVVANDPRLFANYENHGGIVVFGIGYDVNNNGYSYVPGADETGHAGDAADHYKEGWMTAGYWSYNTIDGRETFSTSLLDWGYALAGFTGRPLENNSWDWWSYSPAPDWFGGNPDSPVAATAVPEPSSIMALCSLIGFAGSVKLLRSRCK
ncbi:MAG: PEP-CTERM sorting domain-containing protein [Armatimonadetes bacterium]|nr:PEP-CTERM sorting domain-containing protein [Armatimonadota bacterium]